MIRLIVADDHRIVREGLRRLLEDNKDMRVVAEAATGDEVLAQARACEADVILLDISMPGPGILEVIQRILVDRPKLRILVLSMHPEEQYAVRTLRAGAAGYLMKDHTPAELTAAIQKVHQGGRFVSSTLAERLAFDFASGDVPDYLGRLSNREFEVLTALAEGLTIKEIAARLYLSPKTVSTYRARLLEKLELRTTADLIRFAIDRKLVS